MYVYALHMLELDFAVRLTFDGQNVFRRRDSKGIKLKYKILDFGIKSCGFVVVKNNFYFKEEIGAAIAPRSIDCW